MASTAADFGERRGGEGEGEAEGEETVRCFRNALLLKDGAFVKDDLWVRNGKVIDPRDRFFDERKAVSIGREGCGRARGRQQRREEKRREKKAEC
jgi:hypothetical protein